MKATKQTREASPLVEVRRNGDGGVTYTCKRCGFETEANAYYEVDYKTMIKHAAGCTGTRPENSRAVEVYNNHTDIEALNDRVKIFAGHIKACIPNGADLSNSEAIALARISMATNLSPFTGETWYIPKKGPHIGIRGLRRKAKEQSLYSKNFRSMRSEEAAEHDVRDCDVGYICELFRHDLTQEAAQINRMAGEVIIPIKPIVGIGIWRRKYPEIGQYKDDSIPHGKSPAWVAKKRAEADALNQAYDIGISLPYSEAGDEYVEVADTEDAGWAVLDEDDEVIRHQAAINGERVAQAADSNDTAEHADISDYIARCKAGELELPPWVQEIRSKITTHPKVNDPVDSAFVKQLEISAGRKVKPDQFRAFAEIILTHPLNDLTFGEATVLMNVINGKEFEAQVIGLLS